MATDPAEEESGPLGGFGPRHDNPLTAAAPRALREMDLPDTVALSRQPVDPVAVRALLADPRAWSIERVLQTGSTNADLGGAGIRHGLVRTAEEQVSGRGRSGRDWFCPPGAGLMFSVLLRMPEIAPDRRGWAGALLGVAIVRAIARVSGVLGRLKWPNDVLIDGSKCAGILGEVTDGAMVVGAGINVSLVAGELPRADATSLWLSGGGLDREALLAGILDDFGTLLDRWAAAGGDVDTSGLREEYRDACATIGARVRLILPSGDEVTGRAVDVATDGCLVIEDGGRRHRYSAGDVAHVRLP